MNKEAPQPVGIRHQEKAKTTLTKSLCDKSMQDGPAAEAALILLT